MKQDKARVSWVITLVVTLLLMAALTFALWSSGFFVAARSLDGIRDYIQRFSVSSYLVFFLIQLASVILAPIPSNLTAAAGGLLFGTLPAFLLTFGAVLLGSLIVFQLSRTLGQSFAERFISRRNLEKYEEIIHRKRDTFLFLAFLFPFFPDDLLCIMAGLTKIPFRRFALLVAAARPWGLLVACAVGGSVLQISPLAMALLGGAGLLFFLAAMKYGDRFEKWIIETLKRP